MAEAEQEETSQTFLGRLSTLLTHGFDSLAVSLGVQTGLFDALIDLQEQESTAQEIADVAGLKERYVREWLGAMVVARIVDINPENEKYRLPAHRVPFFKKGTDASDLATMCTAIPMLTEVYYKLAECLKKDGPPGLPYSDYTTFHSFMAKISGRWVNNHLIQDFIPSMPKLEEQLRSGIKVLDLGCGRGVSTNVFAENFPDSTIIGLDFSEESTNFGREAAKQKKITNVEFVSCNAASMPSDWSDTIDYVYVFDVIHDLAHADKVLKEVYRVLKPGGTFSVLDPDCKSKQSGNVGNRVKSRLYSISLFHCLPVSLYFEGSLGLGTAMGREKGTALLKECGFSVESITIPPGSVQVHYMCSKPK